MGAVGAVVVVITATTAKLRVVISCAVPGLVVDLLGAGIRLTWILVLDLWDRWLAKEEGRLFGALP